MAKYYGSCRKGKRREAVTEKRREKEEEGGLEERSSDISRYEHKGYEGKMTKMF